MDYNAITLIKEVSVPYMKNMFKGLDSSFFKIGKGIINLHIKDRFKGCSYADMINNALGTNINYVYMKSSVSLNHIGQSSSMIAWFAHFDGEYRRSGADGCYTNIFVNENKIIERCNIEDADEYIKKRSSCPPIRLVFQRDPDFTGNNCLCEFKGAFHCDSVKIYKKGTRLIGESVLTRFEDVEEFLHE